MTWILERENLAKEVLEEARVAEEHAAGKGSGYPDRVSIRAMIMFSDQERSVTINKELLNIVTRCAGRYKIGSHDEVVYGIFLRCQRSDTTRIHLLY